MRVTLVGDTPGAPNGGLRRLPPSQDPQAGGTPAEGLPGTLMMINPGTPGAYMALRTDPTPGGHMFAADLGPGTRRLAVSQGGSTYREVLDGSGALIQQSAASSNGTTTVRYFNADPAAPVAVQTVTYRGSDLVSVLDERRDGSRDLTRYDEIGVAEDTLRFDANGRLVGRSLDLDEGSRIELDYNSDRNLTGARRIDASGSVANFAGGVGGVLGSALGSLLGGNSLEGRALGSTLVGALGREVFSSLSLSGSFSDTLTGIGLDGLSELGRTLDRAFGTPANNGIAPVSGPSNFIATLLVAEAGEAMGLNGLAGAAFSSAGVTITAQLVENIGSMVLASAAGASFNPAVCDANGTPTEEEFYFEDGCADGSTRDGCGRNTTADFIQITRSIKARNSVPKTATVWHPNARMNCGRKRVRRQRIRTCHKFLWQTKNTLATP